MVIQGQLFSCLLAYFWDNTPELSATAVNHPLGSLDVKGVTILTPAVAKSFRGFNIFSYSGVRSVHGAPIKERGKGDQAE